MMNMRRHATYFNQQEEKYSSRAANRSEYQKVLVKFRGLLDCLKNFCHRKYTGAKTLWNIFS